MTGLRVVAAILVSGFASRQASAQLGEGPVTGELGGYIEGRHHVLFGLDPETAKLPFLPPGLHPDERYGAIERLRPTLKLNIGSDTTVVATPLLTVGHLAFDREPKSIDDLVTVERLYFTATDDDLDLTFGKQSIAWGSGLLLNPTDPFNERDAGDLTAERVGVLAARLTYGVDERSNVALVAAVPAETCCAGRFVGRADTTMGTTDAAVTTTWDQEDEHFIGGLDLRGEWGVGLWIEATATVPSAAPSDVFPTVELGVDYSFEVVKAVYLSLEYLHQGDGEARPGARLDRENLRQRLLPVVLGEPGAEATLAETFTRDRLLLGSHYAVALLRLELSSWLRAQALDVTNLVDGSGLISPQLIALALESLTITLGAQLTYGPTGGEFTTTLPRLTEADHSQLALVNPGLATTLHDIGGARLLPTANLYLWGRHAF